MQLRLFSTRALTISRFLCRKNVQKLDLKCSAIPWQIHQRFKHTTNKGVNGLRNRKYQNEPKEKLVHAAVVEQEQCENITNVINELNLEDSEYDLVANGAMRITRKNTQPQNVLVVQPYVKWPIKRLIPISPEDQIKEAEALIYSITNWRVALSLKVPLESLERKTLFGKGKLEELKKIVHELRQAKGNNQQPITCIFVSKGSLSFAQKVSLETAFNLPVMDRYSVVIQILRLHATSAEARLQVAMAEIPYIWAQAKDANFSKSTKLGYSLTDKQRDILRSREKKLKNELDRIREHRKLLRNKRKQNNYPIIAVIGYTNAGKTSIIKALTKEMTLEPRDQLFATLDVTAHAGKLPCKLEVIYMDTVGFMSDLPTGLIECFVATLEDAMLSDVILHIQDVSHNCFQSQKEHVEQTLQVLMKNFNTIDDIAIPPVINVGNKVDLIDHNDDINFEGFLVSAKQHSGLSGLLEKIEMEVLKSTQRKTMTIRVPNGGVEMSWLYKNSAVVNIEADSENSQHLLMHIIIKESVLQQFKKKFCQ